MIMTAHAMNACIAASAFLVNPDDSHSCRGYQTEQQLFRAARPEGRRNSCTIEATAGALKQLSEQGCLSNTWLQNISWIDQEIKKKERRSSPPVQ